MAIASSDPAVEAESAVHTRPERVHASAAQRLGPVLSVARLVLGRLFDVVWPMAVVFVVWFAWVELKDLPPAVAPHPGDVLRYIAEHPREYLVDAWHTFRIVTLGLVAGAVAGVVLAAISWFSPMAQSMISLPAMITQCLPVATLVPVIARVFGYEERTVVIVAALIAFFPVMAFTATGLRATPPGADDLFHVLGAQRWQRFRLLAVPSAVPRLLVSLRMSVVGAVVGAMLAQWIMGTEGLGYRLAVAQASFRTSEAWGASVVAIVLGVTMYSIASMISDVAERRFT